MTDALQPLPLPPGVTTRYVDGVNGLRMHVLEAGDPADPCVLLLHGFPELAFSWRAVMPGLAAAGFHVIAPDQRGYGRTTGWDDGYDVDIAPYRPFSLVTDLLALLAVLEIDHVACVVGHDFGSPVAAWAALVRPDVFRAVVLMSGPFAGPPPAATAPRFDLDAALARLDPPRRHYTHFYSSPQANADLMEAPQGLQALLRAYSHVKSGDFAGNVPTPLPPGPDGFAQLPTYYVMRRDQGMAETVAPAMPSGVEIAACDWLPDADLAVYVGEFGRTGFQGGLNWYRAATDPALSAELRLFAGRTLDVPSAFIAGDRDWGVHQSPGGFAAMQGRACTDMRVCELVPGAGHWVQQEAPTLVLDRLLGFLRGL